MSAQGFEILEAVRLALISDPGVHAVVADRIYPVDAQMVSRLSVTGGLPLITFSMSNYGVDAQHRVDAIVEIQIVNKSLDKSVLWSIYWAASGAMSPRLLQAAAEAATPTPVLVRVQMFRATGAVDEFLDQDTRTYRLRATYRTLYTRS